MQLTVILTLHFEGFSSLDVPALQRALRQQQATIQQQLQSFLLLHQSGLKLEWPEEEVPQPHAYPLPPTPPT